MLCARRGDARTVDYITAHYYKSDVKKTSARALTNNTLKKQVILLILGVLCSLDTVLNQVREHAQAPGAPLGRVHEQERRPRGAAQAGSGW